MHRRAFLGALAALPLAAWMPPAASEPLAGFTRLGSGEFRRFGLLIYEATLWSSAADPLTPPFALWLTYRRNISSRQLVEASVSEMRKLKVASEAQLAEWGAALARIFPDVQPGDRIVGIHEPSGARFLHNGKPAGVVNDAAFASAFFGIWLHPDTSAPELRAALLRPSES